MDGASAFTEAYADALMMKARFEVAFEPDFRQEIADTWPRQLDDSAARRDWGWKPDFDVDDMTVDMLAELAAAAGAFGRAQRRTRSGICEAPPSRSSRGRGPSAASAGGARSGRACARQWSNW